MAELVPIPLPLLLRRAFLEYRQEDKIFDLPSAKFYRGLPGLDTSVVSNGHRASTPLGPAAGPHDQLAQNIVLCWLGGARIIELKTVQILDELKIPRPCIDAANVGYNVEWSQELKLEQSLREYVSAAMLIEILKASHLIGESIPGDTIFDMSVGYNLEGIRSPRVSSWIQSMKNSGAVVDELRAGLDGPFAAYRDLPFPTCISDTITLSTFHGCPAGEIEGIVRYLLTEMDVHVCVKLNPTMLGREKVEHLLHDVLGYREIQCSPDAFDHDLQFNEAVDLIPRLDAVAKAHGKHLSVKFSNTLVVKNHKSYFIDEVMYLSGPPLHVITMNLVRMFRERMGTAIPISFSAGLDAHNVANAVAMNMVPVTTCTDLLRPGGYSRLVRYMENLGEAMRACGATRISEFIMRYRGHDAAATVDAAGLLNTPLLVEEATANPRYSWERNKGVPRKVGSKLWFYDCINCDKCIPVCPNDANFVYDSPADVVPYDDFEWTPEGIRRVPGGLLKLVREHQLANYADACNECGNCDVMCPEDGGPFNSKPRFFGSIETYEKYASPNGFYISYAGGLRTILGTIDGKRYRLTIDRAADRSFFDAGDTQIEIQLSTGDVLRWTPSRPGRLDMLPYQHLRLLLDSVGDARHVHFANVAGLSLQESTIGNQTGPLKSERLHHHSGVHEPGD
jgi:putative selenate reductase